MTGRVKRIGYLTGWASIILNTALFAIKYWGGHQANSVAMTADAWHTLSDTLTSIIVIIGFWVSSKPPDKEHPFGHGRAESIAAIIIATLLAMVAFDFIVEAINRFSNPEAVNYSSLIIIIFASSILLKEAMAQFSLRVGKKLNSESLRADGWHHRSDAITTLIIVIGAIFGSNIIWLDGAMGIIVALLILYAAYEILKKSMSSLLGESPGKKIFDEINELVLGVDDKISDVHNTKLHTYGDLREMTVHIRLPKDLSVDESHNITCKIENAILKEKNIKATIHVEPRNY
ncbi:cation diffusion facilitator family transporter [Bacteroidota bacterium]